MQGTHNQFAMASLQPQSVNTGWCDAHNSGNFWYCAILTGTGFAQLEHRLGYGQGVMPTIVRILLQLTALVLLVRNSPV